MRRPVSYAVLALLLVALCAGCLGGVSTTSDTEESTVTVTRVIDGDTLEIRHPNGTTDTVRLLGVDTPEVHVDVNPREFEGVPATDAGRCWLRGWGTNASEFAKTELEGEQVTLTFDANEGKRGYYGRLLAYVTYDGQSFNAVLVKRGYARVYVAGDAAQEPTYLEFEEAAQQDNRGVWGYNESAARATCG